MRPYLFRLPEWLGTIPDWVPFLGGTQFGGRPVFAYGVMLGISFLLGWVLSVHLIDRTGVGRKRAGFLMLWAAIGAIVGARVLYFVASAPEGFSLSAFFRFQDGGLVAYGGFLGGISASAVAAIVTRTPWWGAADCVAPAMALGTGITRTGCFLYGCDFGSRTDSFWALHFPHWSNPAIAEWIPGSAPAFAQHYHGRIEETSAVLSGGVHPTQLLMSLNGYACFFLLMLLLPYRRFKGQIILLFLAYYAVTRFLVELLRGDKIRGTSTLGLPVSTSQFVSLCLVVFVAVMWRVLRNRRAS